MDIRKKLVELLKTNACPSPFMCDPTCRYYGFEDCFPDRFADHLIANGVTVQEWVPVTEKLPEDGGYYLVVHRNKYNGSISIAFEMYIKCKIGEWWENDYAYDVTHWMPLPELPKGE